ncbi:MAG: hypothetical protein WA628_26210 [Terriglobales bacterium]
MATGAFAFAEKYILATRRVAGELACLKLALQEPQIADYRANLRFPERAESRHTGSRYAVRNSGGHLGIGEMPHVDAPRDIGAFVAPPSIQSVACGAASVEGSAAGYSSRLDVVIPEIMLLRERAGAVKCSGAQQERESKQQM